MDKKIIPAWKNKPARTGMSPHWSDPVMRLIVPLFYGDGDKMPSKRDIVLGHFMYNDFADRRKKLKIYD